MDTTARRRRAHTVVVSPHSELYNHDVTFYKVFPLETINLTEFEELAIDRVHMLRILEQATLKGFKMLSDEWKHCVREDLVKNNLKKYVRLMNGINGQSELDIQARRADHISHYILKLAYCRSEDLRRWFLTRELEWFRTKFSAQNSQAILKFLNNNNLNYTPISLQEKSELQEELTVSTIGMSAEGVTTSDFYKVPFLEVLPLVSNRKVYLKDGYAYVPMKDLVVCLLSKFRSALSESLNSFYHKLPLIDDDRLGDLLCNLHLSYTGKSYTLGANKEGVNPADLDHYARTHYPLCMKHLHEALRANHHLKHNGRLIYGLFLKAIGLSYELFLEFWREEFTRIMDNDKFNKSYLYNFNHQWGKVGRMVDYSPYNCMKIIMGNVGPGESHGCPFKHFEASLLKSKLVEYGLSADAVNEIMSLSTGGHYQLACTKYFEHTHAGAQPSNTINHPNQYFDDSMKLAKPKVN
ncbi:DNA primase large subunit [Anthonomus grandis grandis]|uniref:DNA primase large subunit n=1 Tax=Anthonomus grandis grandis TaxID=2921223 RepID=UPI0021660BF9|nr:DNA primase large subunit [Anthonomus grandis grandis]